MKIAYDTSVNIISFTTEDKNGEKVILTKSYAGTYVNSQFSASSKPLLFSLI